MTTAGVAPFAARLDRVRARMAELGVGSLGLSVGPDLPWLSGYEAMPLERLTMLVIPADGEATLVVPGLEASRVTERPDLFSIRPWSETEDPIEIVAGLVGTSPTLALGDRTWARFVIDLDRRLPAVELRRAVDVVGPLRAVKDDHEIAALSVELQQPSTVSSASSRPGASRSSGAPKPRCRPISGGGSSTRVTNG